MTLPTILTTTIIRGAEPGERHGGIYLVDLETEQHELIMDWATCDIDWEGRGGARGLRGIAMRDGTIYLVASDEVLVYDAEFNPIATFPNPYLHHCHEIHLHDDELYITSTHYDSILTLNITTGIFTNAYCVRDGERDSFNPYSDSGPQPKDTTHLNMVYRVNSRLYYACNFLDHLYYIENGKRHTAGQIPKNTHNARPFRGGVLYNYTGGNRVVWGDLRGGVVDQWDVPLYDESLIAHYPHAKQGWARGLYVHENIVITGYSPATIIAYDLDQKAIIRHVNLSMNVRNAPHGLCVYEGAT